MSPKVFTSNVWFPAVVSLTITGPLARTHYRDYSSMVFSSLLIDQGTKKQLTAWPSSTHRFILRQGQKQSFCDLRL